MANGDSDYIIDWIDIPNGTPDYFNACSPEFYVTVPTNANGYQQPFHGNAFAGLITTYPPLGYQYREMLSCKLPEPMQIGQKNYCAKFLSPGKLL